MDSKILEVKALLQREIENAAEARKKLQFHQSQVDALKGQIEDMEAKDQALFESKIGGILALGREGQAANATV